MTPPRYQDIGADKVVLLSSDDGGALVRLIAGDLDGHEGPGVDLDADHLRCTRRSAPARGCSCPGTRTSTPSSTCSTAPARSASKARRSARASWPSSAPATRLSVEADATQDSRSPNLDVLVLGGQPIREPVVFHGPFVMNTREEIFEAIEDYHAGRLGTIPAEWLRK